MSVRKAKYGTPVVLALILASCASTQPTANSLLGLHATADAAEARTFRTAKTDDLDAPLRQAQELRLEGNLQGAGTILAQLVLASPDDARVLGEYGKVLAAQGRADDAIAFLQRSAQLQQNDWTIFSAMGVAYDQKANYKAAKVAYERALLLKPGEPSVLSNAALSRMLAGDLNGAEQMLTQASVDSKDPRIAKNLALVRSLKASAPTQVARATPPKAAPIVAPVVAAKSAPTPVAANVQAPAKPMAKTYELLKNDPTVRMAPIPREAVAAKPAPATKTAQSVPHVLPAPAPQAPAPATKTAATVPAATAAPTAIVKEGAMQVQKTAAKEPPKAAAKPAAPVKAVANAETKPAASTKPTAPAGAAPVKAAANPQAAPAAVAATAPAKPAAKVAQGAAKPAAKPVVLPAKPKAPDVETAMLRPAVSEVTPEGATAHKNAPPQGN